MIFNPQNETTSYANKTLSNGKVVMNYEGSH